MYKNKILSLIVLLLGVYKRLGLYGMQVSEPVHSMNNKIKELLAESQSYLMKLEFLKQPKMQELLNLVKQHPKKNDYTYEEIGALAVSLKDFQYTAEEIEEVKIYANDYLTDDAKAKLKKCRKRIGINLPSK